MGEMTIEGTSVQNATIPTQNAEWVSSHAIQSVAMRCTQDPVQHTMLPE